MYISDFKALIRWPTSVTQNQITTEKQKSHGKIKKLRQNKKATAKQKSCGKIKKPRQNKKATAK